MPTTGVVVGLIWAARFAAGSEASERFEKILCLRYATAPSAPLATLLGEIGLTPE